MTKNRALLAWLTTLLLLLIAAGQSWQTFTVSEDVGGGDIYVTGFQAFPVIGAIIALQIVLIFVGLLVKPLITRLMIGAITPLLIWVLLDIIFNTTEQVNATFAGSLAEKTGVIADPTNSELVVASSGTIFPIVFSAFLVLNVLVLVFIAITVPKLRPATKERISRDLPEDLWSNQSSN